MKRYWWLLGLGVGGGLAYLLMRRRTSQTVPAPAPAVPNAPAPSTSAPVPTSEEAALRRAVPEEGQPYVADILRVSREQGVSPFVLAAIMEHESGYGTMLRPPGPAGKSADGRDHGLMQLTAAAHAEFLTKRNAKGTLLWQIPYENIREAARTYNFFRNYFASTPSSSTLTVSPRSGLVKRGIPPGTYTDPRPLQGPTLEAAALAAYNAGQNAVLASIAAGKPADSLTSRGTYAGQQAGYATLVSARLATLVGKAA